MDLKEFVKAYGKMPNLSDILWDNFPDRLQDAAMEFMTRWADELPLRHRRELSGLDDMSVEDLLAYAHNMAHEREVFTICEVYSYSEWAVGKYRSKEGEEYEVMLTKSYDKNIADERKEVHNIEKGGKEIPQDDPIWKEVKLAVEN